MTTVKRWTGREARALREALRLSVRGLARYLGVAVRTVAAWDAGGQRIIPRPEMQAALDTALEHGSGTVQERFSSLLAGIDRRTADPSAGDERLQRRPGLRPRRRPAVSPRTRSAPTCCSSRRELTWPAQRRAHAVEEPRPEVRYRGLDPVSSGLPMPLVPAPTVAG